MIERIGKQAYRLRLTDSWRIHNVFHVSLIKRWKAAAYQIEPEGSIAELNIDGEPRFEVEKILRWRRKAGGNHTKEYLVLWAGYPLEEATWEPEEHFDDAAALQRSLEEDNPPEDTSCTRTSN